MRVWRRIGASALLLLAATRFPELARAEPERLRLQLVAPKGCPDEAAFLHALRKRTALFQVVGDTQPGRRFVATVTETGSSVSGRLEIQGPGTQVSERKVSGRNCEEVVTALAFMTALAIDANVAERVSPRPTPASTQTVGCRSMVACASPSTRCAWASTMSRLATVSA